MIHLKWLYIAVVTVAVGAGNLFADDKGPAAEFPWLHEGTVLTFDKHTAYVPGQPFTWKQNEDGDWIDPRTGKSYDKLTNYGTSAPLLGELRVLAIDGKSVALDQLDFGLEKNLGFPDPVLQAATPPLIADVAANSYWKSPALLAKEATDASKGKLVTQVTWPFGEKKVDAVRIQVTNDSLYQVEIYDLKTGLCLHVASSWKSEHNGDTEITRADLIRVRDLDIPWLKEPVPDDVKKLEAMHYTGEIKKGGAFARLAPQQVVIDFKLKDHGDRWFTFDTTGTLSGLMVATPSFVYGPGQFGGLWIGPKAAASLHEGQVLDDDPDSKMKTVVTKVTAEKVEITTSNQSSGRAYVYDLATGLQTAWAEYDGPTKTSQTMHR